MSQQCGVSLTLDFDSIGCTEDAGHVGPHRDHGEDGEFVWVDAESFDNDPKYEIWLTPSLARELGIPANPADRRDV